MKRDYMFGAWWDGTERSVNRNGYNRATEEDHAVFRIGKLHFWWGTAEDS